MPGLVHELEFAAAPGRWQLYRAEPVDELKGMVVEFWEVRGDLAAFRETLLPNGCVELMINLGPAHRVLSEAGTSVWDTGWFSGLHERALIIESLEGTHLLSARMHPVGATALLGRRVARAANAIVRLDDFIGPDAPALRDRACAATSPAERFAILEDFLLGARATGEEAPAFAREAAAAIEAAHGNLRVTTLHERFGISRKHLAVSFERAVGVPMKSYAQIRRFVWTLARLQETSEVNWSMLSSEAGYSDQSHLARDFRRIGAASPTEYLRKRAPDGSALLYEAEPPVAP
ncbi:MAG TPA: helix-turn-helix domain-containing protein [Gemmatimonadaceae bacterium]|nr:helix-turn-helix domain-containing protein [Gemmatimonadaceae bacterium]